MTCSKAKIICFDYLENIIRRKDALLLATTCVRVSFEDFLLIKIESMSVFFGRHSNRERFLFNKGAHRFFSSLSGFYLELVSITAEKSWLVERIEIYSKTFFLSFQSRLKQITFDIYTPLLKKPSHRFFASWTIYLLFVFSLSYVCRVLLRTTHCAIICRGTLHISSRLYIPSTSLVKRQE